MSEVLSQSEIDALLKSGGETVPQVQTEEDCKFVEETIETLKRSEYGNSVRAVKT